MSYTAFCRADYDTYVLLYGTSSCYKKLLMFKRNCEVPFLLLIYLQRVWFSPPSHVSLLLQQNEVSKYISFLFQKFLFFPFLCFVLSFLFIPTNIWHVCRRFFPCDFCTSNICFVSVANGVQKWLSYCDKNIWHFNILAISNKQIWNVAIPITVVYIYEN